MTRTRLVVLRDGSRLYTAGPIRLLLRPPLQDAPGRRAGHLIAGPLRADFDTDRGAYHLTTGQLHLGAVDHRRTRPYWSERNGAPGFRHLGPYCLRYRYDPAPR